MRTTILLLALLAPACRMPIEPATGSAPQYDAPRITRVRAEVTASSVIFTASIFGPARQHGNGWVLQVQMDTDQARNPFGADYIVLGNEMEGAYASVRQYTCCPTSRATETGKALLVQGRGYVKVSVPREAIGGDDGDLWFDFSTFSQGFTVQRFTGVIKDGQGVGIRAAADRAGSDAGARGDQLLHQE